MNLLVLLPLFLQEVFTHDAVVSGRLFTRLTHLDNVRPDGTPAVIYQSRSKLVCASFCGRDEACLAVMHHGGQCYIYRTPLSPSNVSLPGARGFNKRVHFVFVGCYKGKALKETRKRYLTGLTPEVCQQECYRLGYTSGTMHIVKKLIPRRLCRCADAITSVSKNESHCNEPCNGDLSKICGGFYSASVYKMAILHMP
ncbi:uncharacterized protein LOC124261340 [Haliotis rubra]|uniref:uncharacterized protein LOC124261340 n=1 Tax=Haliotis rubra TaxID=36100 RepID=UPI001EE51107|nr:uncharacterized protein LOC124261340 [Haliotis rubra]